ncbi:MAG: V-type ATP synthase subunit D [Thermoplasmata archaeon]
MREYKPTRSELLLVKKNMKIARNGHQLLKRRQDGLISKFFVMLKEAKEAREELCEKLKVAEERMAIAVAMEGISTIRSAAFTRHESPEIAIAEKNVMGVIVPVILADNIRKRIDQRGYGIIGTSHRIGDAAKAYEDVLVAIINVSEKEAAIKKLLDDIEGTRRRVNALEFKIIPELENTEKVITMRLEELERENIFRLKRFKKSSGALA